MIEAKELRIGNLVTCLGKEVELIGISKWNGNNYTTLHYAEFKGIIPIQLFHLKPIPLNEEWLLNFGFKSNINKHSGCGYSIFGDFKLWIDNSKITYWKVKGSVELKHIHQLQNLYHALTNEELTLNK